MFNTLYCITKIEEIINLLNSRETHLDVHTLRTDNEELEQVRTKFIAYLNDNDTYQCEDIYSRIENTNLYYERITLLGRVYCLMVIRLVDGKTRWGHSPSHLRVESSHDRSQLLQTDPWAICQSSRDQEGIQRPLRSSAHNSLHRDQSRVCCISLNDLVVMPMSSTKQVWTSCNPPRHLSTSLTYVFLPFFPKVLVDQHSSRVHQIEWYVALSPCVLVSGFPSPL